MSSTSFTIFWVISWFAIGFMLGDIIMRIVS